MLYANRDEDKVLATPRATGSCPSCGESLRAKCGEIVIWHWAHVNDSGCAAEHEPETDWHRKWKSEFPKECVEVPIGEHRADVLSPRKIVIEFQHSGISAAQIRAREAEYGDMVWVLDGREAFLNNQIQLFENSPYLKIRTSRWRTTLKEFRKPVFIDIDGYVDMVHVRDFSQRKQTYWERKHREEQMHWGYGGSYESFVSVFQNPSARVPFWMMSPKLMKLK